MNDLNDIKGVGLGNANVTTGIKSVLTLGKHDAIKNARDGLKTGMGSKKEIKKTEDDGNDININTDLLFVQPKITIRTKKMFKNEMGSFNRRHSNLKDPKKNHFEESMIISEQNIVLENNHVGLLIEKLIEEYASRPKSGMSSLPAERRIVVNKEGGNRFAHQIAKEVGDKAAKEQNLRMKHAKIASEITPGTEMTKSERVAGTNRTGTRAEAFANQQSRLREKWEMQKQQEQQNG